MNAKLGLGLGLRLGILLALLVLQGCQMGGAPAPVGNIGERGNSHQVQRAKRSIRLHGGMDWTTNTWRALIAFVSHTLFIRGCAFG